MKSHDHKISNQIPQQGRQGLVAVLCALSLRKPLIAMAQTPSYNYAEGVDFTPYETYQWVNIAGADTTDQALDRDIKRAIDAQLAAKGLTKSKDSAQLCVAYQISFPRETQIRQYDTDGYAGYGPGWRYGYSHGYSYLGSAMSTTLCCPAIDNPKRKFDPANSVSNDTSQGCRQNRHVEIITSGEVIGTKIGVTASAQ